MLIISIDTSHHLCCLELLSPHLRFPILPSAHLVKLQSPPVQWKSSCQGHQEPSCCQIRPSFLCQQVLTTPSFLSLWTTHCPDFPFTSRANPSWSSFLGSPFSLLDLCCRRGPGCLWTLFFVFTFSLHHLIQYHPKADVHKYITLDLTSTYIV